MLQLTLPGDVRVSDPSGFKFTGNQNLGNLVSALLPYVFAFSGIILFLMFISGGFTLLTSVGNEEKVKKGKQTLTSAIIGFAIIFCVFWLMQIIQIVFGLDLGF